MKKLITRTISINKVNALVLNKEDNSTFRQYYIVSNVKNEKSILNEINDMFEKEFPNFKAVAVLETKTIEKLLAMTEEDFIKNAFELDERKQYI